MCPEEAVTETRVIKAGAISPQSLADGCPAFQSILHRRLLAGSDVILCLSLRIVEGFTPKAFIGLQASSALARLGLFRAAAYVKSRIRPRRKRSTGHQPESPLLFPIESLSASVEPSGAKFSPPTESSDVTDWVPRNGIGSPAFHVGGK